MMENVPRAPEMTVPSSHLLINISTHQIGVSINPTTIVTAFMPDTTSKKGHLLVTTVKPVQFCGEEGIAGVFAFQVVMPANMQHRVSVMCDRVYECPPWSTWRFMEALLGRAAFPPTDETHHTEGAYLSEMIFKLCSLEGAKAATKQSIESLSNPTPRDNQHERPPKDIQQDRTPIKPSGAPIIPPHPPHQLHPLRPLQQPLDCNAMGFIPGGRQGHVHHHHQRTHQNQRVRGRGASRGSRGHTQNHGQW
ncbi:protein ORF113 [Cyprinid herpesvirus 1]|uniref:Protein ORF113 n=1 Tax=Cyprinid herpesvirus 1 TaxID=317858 RepID=K7PBY0_9VIRU|nr:protein ORF113 [Cyprinid herpesvirus 1]AFJ20408.1 protein ORF113 [Cyprinid herpesvirus 1]